MTLAVHAIKRISFTTLAALLAITFATGCSVMPSTKSGFLSGYEQIAVNPEGTRGAYRSPQSIDAASARVVDVRWHVQGEVDIAAAEQAQLTETFKGELISALKKLPPQPDGRAVEVRAAITVVKAVSPALNFASTALLFVPLDEGGAAVEIEAVDAQTGQQLAALVIGSYAPLSEFKARFSSLAPAEFALKGAAEEFAKLVAQPSAN